MCRVKDLGYRVPLCFYLRPKLALTCAVQSRAVVHDPLQVLRAVHLLAPLRLCGQGLADGLVRHAAREAGRVQGLGFRVWVPFCSETIEPNPGGAGCAPPPLLLPSHWRYWPGGKFTFFCSTGLPPP